jgi:hypothetical protein
MMFEDFWYNVKEGLFMIIVLALGAMIIPSSATFGFYLMGKITPQLAPTCEVRK